MSYTEDRQIPVETREIQKAIRLGYQPPRGATFGEELSGARAFILRLEEHA